MTSINAGADNDFISNQCTSVTIDAGAGDDTIRNFRGTSHSSKLQGGDGNDSIENDGRNVTIEAGAGNDYIYNWGLKAIINGGAGNDYISNNVSQVTIEGGKDNDTIKSDGYNVHFRYKAGDGNDLITGFKGDSTLDLGLETFASIKSGNDLIVRLEDGEVTLSGAATLSTVHIKGIEDKRLNIDNTRDNVSIIGSLYDDIIRNYRNNVTILGNAGNDSITNLIGSFVTIIGNGGNDFISITENTSNIMANGSAGDDSIYNSGDSVTIDGGLGNDSITNNLGFYVSISAGAGNDYISNRARYTTINGGAGHDSIYNSGDSVTIDGGLSDDLISLGANSWKDLIKYTSGDGNDIIYGFKTNSTLSIASGTAFSQKSGSDIIITVGAGQITLSGAAALYKLNIIETPVNIHNTDSNATIYGTNTDDTIINTGENAAILALSGNDSLNNNGASVTVDGGAGDDLISNTGKRSTLTGQSGSDTIHNNAGEVLALCGAGDDSIFNHGEGVTISGGSGSNVIENYTNSNDGSIIGGASNDSLQNRSSKVTISGKAGDDTILSNGTSNSILGGAGNDLINLQNAYKNTILGGAGNDSIKLDWSSNNVLIKHTAGDGSDLIEGFNATSTLQIGSGNETYIKSIAGDDVIVSVDKEKITLKGAAKLANLNIDGTTILNVDNTENVVALIGGRLDDSVKNSGNRVTIQTFAGGDIIENSGSRVTIEAGSGSDTINISNGSVNTISGGADDDFIYISPNETGLLIKHDKGDGNDYITGFNATSTLQLGDGTDTFSKTVKGGNVIVTTGTNKITLAGTSTLSPLNIVGSEIILGENIHNHNKNVVVNGTAGNDTIGNYVRNVTISGNGGNDYISNVGYNVSISGGIGNDTIFNEAGNTTVRSEGESITLEGADGNDVIENRVDYVSISGGEGDDSISSYRSNNTIIGGTGNDTIYNNWNFLKNNIMSGTDAKNVVFNYTAGDGSDVIYGFNSTSTLNIAGVEFTSTKSGDDIIITMGGGNVTLKDAAKLSTVNVVHAQIENPLDIVNAKDETLIMGTSFDDTITNSGSFVTVQALGGNDSIVNDGGYFSSIAGGEGSDLISVANSSQVTINAGKANDTINLSSSDETFIEYNAGDGNDVIYGFDDMATLNIAKTEFTTATAGDDLIITVGADKITLAGAASLSNPNISNGTHATFIIKNSAVTCESDLPESIIKDAYRFNADSTLLTLDGKLKDYAVKVKADDAAKIKWHYGTASLSSYSTLEYRLADEENIVTLTSKNYGDKLTFNENATFNFGRIKAEVFDSGTVSTKSAEEISFENNSSANVTAPRNYKIDINSSNIMVNDLPVNAKSGASAVTVERNGMSFSGYGTQFADLEVAKESYFGKLAPMTVNYNSTDKIYTLYNTACVKTLSNDFTKLTFDFSGNNNEKYAYYKINGVAILLEKTDEKLETIEVKGSTFKIQDKEIDAANIGRITLDDKITFSGTKIDFDGVITNYAHNKPVSYSLDGKEITLSDAATVVVGENTKTFKCEAGNYIINGRGFETSKDLTFTAGTSEIKIPLTDAQTEIYFDGIKVSGISGGEITFDVANDKITIPNGATLNITSPDEVKLNLEAGNYAIEGKKISVDSALEITVDKDNIKVPLANGVKINGAAIKGTGEATIDNTNELLCSVLLPNGALVENTSENIYQLTGKDSSASFGDANKKVQLIDEGITHIEYYKENTISVGVNRFMFETVEISGVDAWTIEASGTSSINKITGITDGANISVSTEYIDAGDFNFEVETKGAGTFTIAGQKFTTTDDANYVIYGNSDGEIKVAPKSEEFAGDNSEAAGKVYNFDKAGTYTINGITFHAEKGTKAQTITRGVEFDLSSGTFQYDGLTLSGSGAAQINRYNASVVSLTDGAKVSGSDESKYQNRQFEIEGAVEIIGKKFETNEQIRCGLINIQETIDGQAVTLKGFFVDDKYVQIQSDCYEGVKVIDKNISSIEGVKASAEITGNGLAGVSIVTTESGEFKIHDNTYKISGDLDGVTFVMDSHGNIAEINGLAGFVEGNFENAISVNGKAIEISGASSIKVTSDGSNITEISNVAGDLITAGGKSYRKNIRVYELGGAEKLTTSADGTIIFSGNKFEMSAGKTFTLDKAGNVSGIENAQVETANASANVAETNTENFATINLSTTSGLEEVFGDFSERLTVNGVFVKVTDSTNFVVKSDAENVYIETTAPDTFTINGKNFETSADKAIFKLDKSGNVSEIVTDKFYLYPDEEAYLIEGDFSDEIIFNGKKFCVTGTNDTTIFIGKETLITINLARNSIKIVKSSGAAEIALNGEGEITIGDKVLSTSEGFVGSLRASSEGIVDSVENFVGTISGKLGGVELNGITIASDDKFSVTGDGEKITAIENLQNGLVSGDNLDAITINGEKISVDNSEEATLTIQDGKLKTADDAEEITDMFTGDAAKIVTAGSRATVTNYDYKGGEAFRTEYENISDAIAQNEIAYYNGRLTIDSATIIFAEDADSRMVNLVDAADDTQKVGFVSDDSKLDASNEKGSLILVGGNNSTLAGGKGHNQIYLKENSESTVILNGKNTIENFNDGDKISVSANCDFSFDGEKVKIKSGTARATLQSISSDDGAARILTLINGKETKMAIAQEGAIIAAGDDLSDVYYGEKSGVDFSNYEESLTVDLTKNFYGINRVTVGGGLNTLISSSYNETLTGNGTTEYIFGKDSGRDVISNFDFDEDKINVGTNAVTDVRINSTGGVRMEISGSATLTLENAQGKNFKINNLVALVDKNLSYNAEANYFVATSQNASLTVGEGAEIWLDGSHGKTFSGNIRTLDASTAQGKTSLAGNDLDNRIFAGNGDASLWGGNGGDDLLVGGAGKNTFYYCAGNGNDTINGAHDGDIVYLSTVTLDQISGTSITGDAVSINFTDGGSLQVNSNSNVTYQLADGSKYSANHAQAIWLAKN